ncbi:MAG: hypothetical protein JSV35_00275 [Candidatus Bathyarchaeota archaeon]|nr:MAG: hypothetical protein JSV35_00275 [Candidatus Bathyarchaeota archaeon]
MKKIPRVWSLLGRFKEDCKSRGWKTSTSEDLVKIDGEYHNFIGARTTHLSTFKKITSNRKHTIAEGESYHIVDVAYTAWVFQVKPPAQLIEAVRKDPRLSKNTAVYDLSQLYEGSPHCLIINKTASPVFKAFEEFLNRTYGVKVQPLYEPLGDRHKDFKSKLAKESIG